MRSTWVAVVVLCGGVGALVLAAGGLSAITPQGSVERFCTLELPLAPEGPADWNPPAGADHSLTIEDHSPPGPDPCDTAIDGSAPYAVVRGDDCTIAYPHDWPESSKPPASITPFGVDGTCWYPSEG